METKGEGGEVMTVYYGVVHDNRIELDSAARLPEGLRVEVRPHPAGSVDAADRTADEAGEEVVKARLRAAGLLAPAPVADDMVTDEDDEEEFEPVMVQGELLSEQIIRERR